MNTTAYAFHGLELVYVFGSYAAIDLGPFEYKPNATDLEMQAIVQTAWTTFAYGDDPSADGLVWPVYDEASDPYALLDVPPGTGAGVRTDQCDYWDTLFELLWGG